MLASKLIWLAALGHMINTVPTIYMPGEIFLKSAWPKSTQKLNLPGCLSPKIRLGLTALIRFPETRSGLGQIRLHFSILSLLYLRASFSFYWTSGPNPTQPENWVILIRLAGNLVRFGAMLSHFITILFMCLFVFYRNSGPHPMQWENRVNLIGLAWKSGRVWLD